ncbi:copper resistance protein NlpE [Ottowia testudinis]|uniref:Copper resistance protein NlpE N-terminal domain-containing protein n=1 Tax=Ottowia testudinis TaxID=2816950 RepID=A0A975H384_9BURK|nr:surface-adhesin E family protein [Ottowia testudinis]QTD45648.1 copper resistance protein NlpE N-terminal domain-containing protein [Ottowia testudinis]
MTADRISRLTLTALLAVAAAGGAQAAPDTHGARDAVDWAGTYMGTLPSASGGGYRTVLVLRDNDRYSLQQDIEHKGKMESFSATGRFTWDKAGSTITLDDKGDKGDKQRFFVSEGFVEQQGATPPAANMAKNYQLMRMQSYPAKGEELLIDASSVKADQPRKGWTSFDGVWNTSQPTQAGHKSLAARFELNCAARQYRMPTIAYYSQPHKRGKLIDSAKNNDNDIPVTKEDKVMTQVMQDHCPR